MAKIRITESELKGIIRESVMRELNEGIFEDYAERMKNRNAEYNKAVANSKHYQKDWKNMTPQEKIAWADYAIGRGNYDPNKIDSYQFNYNNKKYSSDYDLKRATRRNGTYLQQNLNTANTEKTRLEGEVAQLKQALENEQEIAASYQNGVGQIANTLKIPQNINENYAGFGYYPSSNMPQINAPQITGLTPGLGVSPTAPTSAAAKAPVASSSSASAPETADTTQATATQTEAQAPAIVATIIKKIKALQSQLANANKTIATLQTQNNTAAATGQNNTINV